jgi:hypothetical protein
MTDTELTEIVAKWCGLQYKVVENKAYIKTGIELWYYEEFNPLEDHNDLWNIVIPRLQKQGMTKLSLYQDGKFFLSHDGVKFEIKDGSLPDLNRAVCELIAEIAKEAV